ncbi:hypothetical protein [Rathayibacter sp. AY1F9]|uniref:hypothetical protein n=1 Tax=Rathayibacter sp. AY1F9 TaxID=2080563 RepID=UPI0011B08112|nr:hypothetical protein [Rathayibacter sp. AY1F9]
MVKEPSDVLGRVAVGGAAVLGEVEFVVEHRFDVVVVLLGSFESLQDLTHLDGQPFLLGAQ